MAEAGFLLDARDLGVTLRGASLLGGVDLALSPGDVLAVAGPNGAGKTTLLRCLAGVLAPTSGEVRLANRPLRELSRRETARSVAYCPQESSERLGFTVGEAVLMGRLPWLDRFASPSPADREEARLAMEAMDLDHLAGRRVTELSGGEKRRVALARTLIQAGWGSRGLKADGAASASGRAWRGDQRRPGPVYLLDEPAAGLDIRHALAAMRLFASRAKTDGAAVVAVLHDLNLAAMYCPLMLLLDGGRAAAYGPTARVLTSGNVSRVFGVRSVVDGSHVRFLEDA